MPEDKKACGISCAYQHVDYGCVMPTVEDLIGYSGFLYPAVAITDHANNNVLEFLLMATIGQESRD